MVDLIYLSIPVSAAPSGVQPESDLHQWIKDKVGAKNVNGSTSSSPISTISLPDLKIGTLDNLVIQGEEVGRIDAQIQGLVFKVHDIIQQLYESPEKVVQAEKIDNLDASFYLRQFGWNTAKYRPDKPIGQLLEILTEDAMNADHDLKTRYTAYTTAKTNLAAAERKRGGDLTVRSLDAHLSKEDVVTDSEYLETVLVVVPSAFTKDFDAKYEQLSQMVVPRSAKKIVEEKDHTLYTVVVFKKFASEFAQKARESKWIVRDLEFKEGAAEAAEQDYSAAEAQVNKLKGDITRLASAAFSDIIKAWGHVKVIRLFVESVLRYGLPPTFVTAAFVPNGSTSKAEGLLIDKFGYLGGNAVSRKDDSDLAEFGAVVEHDYKPFVIYVLELP